MEPTPTHRGFMTYLGKPIPTSYGHEITVQESSAASGPHLWLFIGDSAIVKGHDPHLDLVQALLLRKALDQFIEAVPERWRDGQVMLEDAKNRVELMTEEL